MNSVFVHFKAPTRSSMSREVRVGAVVSFLEDMVLLVGGERWICVWMVGETRSSSVV